MSADYNFRNLILWQKSQQLTLDVIKLIALMPRTAVADVIVKQIIRSSSSIAANIAEGHGRFTPGAHSNHLSIAKGSACETDGWLDLLRKSGFISADQEQRLHAVCLEIVAMLTAKILELEKIKPTTARRAPVIHR